MDSYTCLAVDVEADAARVTEILSTTEGQRSLWTADCDVSADRARFGFAAAPVDLECEVTVETGKLVRMRVTSGFPFWEGSTFEWELGAAGRAGSGTQVLFRHHGFAEGHPEADLGYTAQVWAMVLDRLTKYVATGTPQPFFPEGPA